MGLPRTCDTLAPVEIGSKRFGFCDDSVPVHLGVEKGIRAGYELLRTADVPE